MYDQYYVILIRWQKIIWFVCLLFRHVRRGCDCPFIGCFNLTEFFMLCFCSKKFGWNSFLNHFFIAFWAKRSSSLYLINHIFLNFQNSKKKQLQFVLHIPIFINQSFLPASSIGALALRLVFSLLIRKVKQHWERSVLGWVTVLLLLFFWESMNN